jgi:hypothetical protein
MRRHPLLALILALGFVVSCTREPKSALESPRPATREDPCAHGVTGDFNGDGKLDRAFHDRASLSNEPSSADEIHVGVCLTGGRSSELDGSEGTVFRILDIEPDGRDEIWYGGTTAGGAAGDVAVIDHGILVRVQTEFAGALTLSDHWFDGFSAFGCGDFDGDGVRELNVVKSDLKITEKGYVVEKPSAWRMVSFRLAGPRAVVVGFKSGKASSEKEIERLPGGDCWSERGERVK